MTEPRDAAQSARRAANSFGYAARKVVALEARIAKLEALHGINTTPDRRISAETQETPDGYAQDRG